MKIKTLHLQQSKVEHGWNCDALYCQPWFKKHPQTILYKLILTTQFNNNQIQLKKHKI